MPPHSQRDLSQALAPRHEAPCTVEGAGGVLHPGLGADALILARLLRRSRPGEVTWYRHEAVGMYVLPIHGDRRCHTHSCPVGLRAPQPGQCHRLRRLRDRQVPVPHPNNPYRSRTRVSGQVSLARRGSGHPTSLHQAQIATTQWPGRTITSIGPGRVLSAAQLQG